MQALLLRCGVLGWVLPLLLAYDTTHEEGGPSDGSEGGKSGDKGGSGSSPPEGGTGGGGGGGLPPALDIGQGGRSVPDFLGLGVERPNMQVRGCSGCESLGLGS